MALIIPIGRVQEGEQDVFAWLLYNQRQQQVYHPLNTVRRRRIRGNQRGRQEEGLVEQRQMIGETSNVAEIGQEEGLEELLL